MAAQNDVFSIVGFVGGGGNWIFWLTHKDNRSWMEEKYPHEISSI